MFRSKLFFIFLFPLLASAYASPGNPGGFVNDYAGLFNSDQKQILETKLSDFKKTTGNEIVVAIIPNLGGDTIENFAVKLFEDWGIGKKTNDNGILVLISKEDRKMRIEVGYGLEGALTDAQSFWVIDRIMKPAFQQENYYQGINEAVDKIISAIQGEVIPSSSSSFSFSFSNIFFWSLFIFIWLASILGRSKSWWLGGVIGGIIGTVLGITNGFLFFGVISMAILIPLGLLLDYKVSRAYRVGRETGKFPWWIGGGGRWGGSSGSGFGGFGGGRSGGGGASGGW